MRRIVPILVILTTLTAAPVRASQWAAPSASYAPATIERCVDPAAAKLRPNEARYDICADQMALFTAALAKAKATGKLLIVDFGATWCPWCRALQAQWPSPALLGGKAGDLALANAFDVLEIGISTVHNGRRIDIPSGHAVLAEVLAAAPGVKLRSVPFVAVLDPADRGKTLARNLDDFEQANAGRHDAAAIKAFLVAAHAYMKQGAAAPSEPSWLVKKLKRAWGRLTGA